MSRESSFSAGRTGFTWGAPGGQRTAHILTIVGTCVSFGINPRAYLHLVTKLLVERWPQSRVRELLPDRIAVSHPAHVIRSGPFRSPYSRPKGHHRAVLTPVDVQRRRTTRSGAANALRDASWLALRMV